MTRLIIFAFFFYFRNFRDLYVVSGGGGDIIPLPLTITPMPLIISFSYNLPRRHAFLKKFTFGVMTILSVELPMFGTR